MKSLILALILSTLLIGCSEEETNRYIDESWVDSLEIGRVITKEEADKANTTTSVNENNTCKNVHSYIGYSNEYSYFEIVLKTLCSSNVIVSVELLMEE